MGRNVSLLMAEPHRMFQEAFAGGQVEGHRKDGSKFPVELCVAAWRTAGKRYFAGIMRDITIIRFKATPKEAELTSATTVTGIGRRKRQPFQLISPRDRSGSVNFAWIVRRQYAPLAALAA